MIISNIIIFVNAIFLANNKYFLMIYELFVVIKRGLFLAICSKNK